MNTYLLNEEISLEEKIYKLKYGRKINILPIVDTIMSSVEYKNFSTTPTETTITLLFNRIFDEIKNVAHQHLCFFDKTSPTAFLGHIYAYYSEDVHLFEIISSYIDRIMNGFFSHCIMHGFIHTLQHVATSTALTGKYHYYNSIGYTKAPLYDYSKHKTEPNSKLPQLYNSMYKRLNQTKLDFYSTHILNNICTKKGTDNFFTTPAYTKNIALFLLNNTPCSKLSKSILNNYKENDILANYNALFASINTETNDLNNIDALLFSSYMEYFFGFSSLNHIQTILTEAELGSNTKANNALLTLNDLYNEQLRTILSTALDCPAIIARNDLLDFALYVLTHTKNFDNRFKSSDGTEAIFFFNPQEDKSTQELIAIAHRNLSNFFSVINNATVPMLEDMWLTVTSLLFKDTTQISNLYTTYIKHNYAMFTNANFISSQPIDTSTCSKHVKQDLATIIRTTFNNTRFDKPDIYDLLFTNCRPLNIHELQFENSLALSIERFYMTN